MTALLEMEVEAEAASCRTHRRLQRQRERELSCVAKKYYSQHTNTEDRSRREILGREIFAEESLWSIHVLVTKRGVEPRTAAV